MLSNFKLNKIEQARAESFFKEHKQCYKSSTIGGGYEFWPTGIGTVIKCKCGFCGAEQDITDYDCW